jgi:hypothetical protein
MFLSRRAEGFFARAPVTEWAVTYGIFRPIDVVGIAATTWETCVARMVIGAKRGFAIVLHTFLGQVHAAA